MDLPQILLLLAAGVITGAVNSVAGGGSLMTFPALLWVGLPPISASVTNSVSVAFGYIGSVVSTRQDLKGQTAWKTLIPSAMAGAVVGCALLLGTPEKAFDWIAPTLVLGASIMMIVQQRITNYDPPQWTKMLVVFAIGIYGGYFIAAIGVVIMAVLGLVINDTTRRVVALKNTLQLGVGVTAAVAYALFGPVQWAAVAALVPGTLLGGFVGGHYGRRLDARALRWIVVGFGMAVAVVLYARLIWQ